MLFLEAKNTTRQQKCLISVGLILGLAVSVYIFAADWSVSHTLPLRVFDFAGRDILYSEINATDSVFIGTYSAETRQIVNQKLILHLAGSEQIKDCVFWRSNRERTKKVLCLSDEQLFIIGLTSRGYELERSVSLDYNPKPSSVNWSYSLINAALEGRQLAGMPFTELLTTLSTSHSVQFDPPDGITKSISYSDTQGGPDLLWVRSEDPLPTNFNAIRDQLLKLEGFSFQVQTQTYGPTFATIAQTDLLR